MEVIHSFNPIVDESSKILILGSMPSVRSLERVEYYGHPTNAFWPIMERLCSYPLLDWEAKVTMLTTYHIGLWDIIGSCSREGSADSAIRNVSYNAIFELLAQRPLITHIICNGVTALRYFNRYSRQSENHAISLPVIKLPSTSAAYTLGTEKKCHIWLQNLNDVLYLSQ